MKICYLDVSIFEDRTVFDRYFSLLPEQRKLKINKLRFEKDKNLSLGAWVLLDKMFSEYGMDIKDYEIRENEYGKPYFKDCTLNFNISHSGKYAVVAVSDNEVGVDIEILQKKQNNIADRFFHKSEIDFLNQFSGEEYDFEFTKMWTEKEAYIKAVGSGMSTPLDSFSVTDEKTLCGYSIKSYTDIHEYIVSVAGKDKTAGKIEEILL